MKYFVMSDIHGHYQIMKEVLDNNGFDQLNPDHKLIVCGDLFDRGRESKEVYQFVKELHDQEKAIVVLGNHDNFMIDFLTVQERVEFNCERNGLDETIKAFSRSAKYDFNVGQINEYKEEVLADYPEMLEWLERLPLYYELENYIFVHAGFNTEIEDWKQSTKREFIWTKKFHLDDFDTSKINKKIVCGHYRTSEMDFLHRVGKYGHYRKGNKIFIDANVEESQKLNILLLEE